MGEKIWKIRQKESEKRENGEIKKLREKSKKRYEANREIEKWKWRSQNEKPGVKAEKSDCPEDRKIPNENLDIELRQPKLKLTIEAPTSLHPNGLKISTKIRKSDKEKKNKDAIKEKRLKMLDLDTQERLQTTKTKPKKTHQ